MIYCRDDGLSTVSEVLVSFVRPGTPAQASVIFTMLADFRPKTLFCIVLHGNHDLGPRPRVWSVKGFWSLEKGF